MTIEFKDIPDPGDASFGALVKRRMGVLKFLMAAGGVARDPILILTLLASVSRSGMIFAINETARTADQGVGWSVVLLLVSAAVLLTSGYFQRLRAFNLITTITRALRERMSRLVLRANIDFLISSPHGQVYAAMTGEVGVLSGAVMNIVEAIGAILVLVIAIPYLFYVSWSAGIASVIALVMGVVGFALLDRPARRYGLKSSQAFAQYCDRVGDMLGGWKELRLRGTRRDALEAETLRVISEQIETKMKAEKLFSASTGIGQSAVIMLLCFVVIAVPLLQGGDTTAMFQVLTIIFLVNGPTETLFSILPRFSRAENAYFKIQMVEKSLKAAQSLALMSDHAPMRQFAEIELCGVEANVRELEKPDAVPFHLGPVSLKFKPGETVFICGGNGSGKTTLLSLITGLRHPEQGEILLDGVPLNDETTAAYRELYSGVFSGFHLFDRAFGMPPEELAELERRVDQLGLSQRVQLLGDKFSSTSLSAGQSRRMALSVALAEKRPIIVLDEFAADQDPANRAFFYDVLVPELTASGRLVLAVTHDDHQFHKCDRLIKMEGGRVVSDDRLAQRQSDTGS